MNRIWQIGEQVVEDPSTGLRLEFSSEHTDLLNAGEDAPMKDERVVMRLWTSDRTRMATYTFERNGRFVRCEVEPMPTVADLAVAGQGADVSMTAQGEHADVIHQWDDPAAHKDDDLALRLASEPGHTDKDAYEQAVEKAKFGKPAFLGL